MRGLTDIERGTIRSALVAELGRAEEQAASLARQFDDIVAAAEMSNIDDEHDPEGTTIAFERAQVSALHRQAVRDAAALRRALADVDDEEFGACEQWLPDRVRTDRRSTDASVLYARGLPLSVELWSGSSTDEGGRGDGS